ncbi:RidA family protein [Pseudohongiella sp. SYSU M77423]|uniref:RidA family protein n=1 Tax=unclassified Pseudohongiella TaxID=2629611 RepID=UPI001F478A76|nr:MULTISPECIES: RidA family protein [unclassified Pseudohongiella]MDH7944319.1 RidA family protein [Pseudohongiella sp. SYSU M77423]MEC8860909.1 RidA family protein [Pseudomonadota bacterium]
MTQKEAITSPRAPAAIGPYSQAIRSGNLVFMSGQIPLDPATMEIVQGGVEAQAHQVLKNLSAVASEAGGSLDDCVKLTIYMIDLAEFGVVNATMEQYFQKPYPARATIQVSALPRGALVEIEAIMQVG